MGTFIVFEGGDGSGKSTQAMLLYHGLLRSGYSAYLTHEPGGTVLGEKVRRMLKGQAELTPLAELFLFSTARAQLLREVVRPALNRGETVVCDRYVPSTIAYQGYGHGLDLAIIHQVTHAATQGLEPDLMVFLNMEPAHGLQRRMRKRLDRFEAQDLEFHRRVRRGYVELAKAEPERWLVVDGSLPKGQVAEIIWQRVEPLLDSLR